MIKTIIYIVCVLLSVFVLNGINFNNFFKKNHIIEARFFVIIISLIMGYLLGSFIIEFLNVSAQYANDATNFESGMREIAESVEQLDQAIDHIAVSMEDIGKMTNEAANGVSLVAEKTVEIVEKMTDEDNLVKGNTEYAGQLSNIVGRFSID